MISGFFASLSGVISSFRRHAVTSNNVANVGTYGYKAGRALARENRAGGVDSTAVSRVNSPGPLIQTGQPLDLAIMGEGFFQVELDDGSIGYCRCGLLTIDSRGQLSTADRQRIVPPVTVPPNATRLVITGGGEIRATIDGQNRILGHMEIARFINPSGLTPLGNTVFAESPASGSPLTGPPGTNGMGILVQGSLEGSNVDLATEFVMDILSSIQLKANINALKTQDEMLGSVLDIKA
jgi:flagellar basal-body rod protein FlgG